MTPGFWSGKIVLVTGHTGFKGAWLAAALVRSSYRNPVETYATNVMGTVHVLEAVRQSQSVRALLNVTSDKCYENREWIWGYREGEPLGGHDPYSSSTACAELVTAASRQSYFL